MKWSADWRMVPTNSRRLAYYLFKKMPVQSIACAVRSRNNVAFCLSQLVFASLIRAVCVSRFIIICFALWYELVAGKCEVVCVKKKETRNETAQEPIKVVLFYNIPVSSSFVCVVWNLRFCRKYPGPNFANENEENDIMSRRTKY